MENPFAPNLTKGGPADYSDPNPVHPDTIYLLMSKNFPPEALQWVKRARWTGPIWVPWDRVDQDDRDKWAASHQPSKVKEFEGQIKAHDGRVAPSIMVQEPNSQKAFIVDGHHRALARENLNQRVLAYLGNIDAKDRQAAEETHSHQIHSGASPENKASMEDLLAKLEDFWYRREIGEKLSRKEIFKALVKLRDAGRDERLLSLQAQDFNWDIEQLDNPVLRSWLCD